MSTRFHCETPESEFLHLVSRGKLTQPREDLFDLC